MSFSKFSPQFFVQTEHMEFFQAEAVCWQDPQTLTFKPAKLAGSSVYSLIVTDEARAVSGARLNKPYKLQFSTPRMQMQRGFPSGTAYSEQPVCYAVFSQRVNASDVLPHLKFLVKHPEARGDNPEEYCGATAASEEMLSEVDLASISESRDHIVVFIPERPLPRGSNVTVVVPRGVPSAEGPLPSLQRSQFAFRVEL